MDGYCKPRLGADYLGGRRCRFRVWAPYVAGVQVRLVSPHPQTGDMPQQQPGYFQVELEDVDPHSRYLYRLKSGRPVHAGGPASEERPDPASRYQPDGVHGPSQVVPADFEWHDDGWPGLPLPHYIIYELHVGTFTPEGTLAAVIDRLDDLKALGITAVELMPVAQFPGERNWGYDGVYPFAVQNSYGGPEALKRLVNACHCKGLAVILDVVYNHLGPEGNYTRQYGPYFTDFYKTPWGEAVNFDGPNSDEVRRFFIENALQWICEFHIDALRIDAVHTILDFSARPFLEVLARTIHHTALGLNRRIHLIAESALNDTRIVRSRDLGGFALDAQWNDDFHHSLHTLLTEERAGYYKDYNGLADLARAWSEGFVYSGQYSSFRQRAHGNSSRNIPARRFVVFSQNHDQVGNRLRGNRLSRQVDFEKLKLAAGVVLLSPFIPLLFMGEEYGETAPFQYFVSHGDPELVAAVRRGRREEFAAFEWGEDPPDPQDAATFLRSKINPLLGDEAPGRCLWEYYRELIRLRSDIPALACLSKKNSDVTIEGDGAALCVQRWCEASAVFMAFNFSPEAVRLTLPGPGGSWEKRLDSAEARWLGAAGPAAQGIAPGGEGVATPAPYSVLLFLRPQD
jgi:maltooligosyltrehalose trehalohydrolase